LDPFGGSGTTGLVAQELGRNAVLLEISPEYVRLMRQRMADASGIPVSQWVVGQFEIHAFFPCTSCFSGAMIDP
jgi:DNA modification methylase